VDKAAIEAATPLTEELIVGAAARTADPATADGAILTEGETLIAVVAGVIAGFAGVTAGVAGVMATWAPLRTISKTMDKTKTT
jgi:hypothetical protein